MTKVLLINPPFSLLLTALDEKEENMHILSLPLGLLYVGTFLENKGYKVRIVDGLLQPNYLDIIKQNIVSSSYVGLSVMTTQVPNALKISKFIKEHDPEIPIIWGGVHPTLFPEQTCQTPLIDFIVRGEGEMTALELIDSLEKGLSLKKVNGITYVEDDEIVYTKPRKYIDMDGLPPIRWELIDRALLNKMDLVPVHTSRGCPHRCTFCINPITRNYWRCKSADKVLDELEELNSHFKQKKVRFWDDNFFVSRKRAQEISCGIQERDIDILWETTVRADYFRQGKIDDEFLSTIKKSGCYKLCFGAESGSQRILNALKKDITIKEIIYSAVQCGRFDIIPEYSFMVGLPGEEEEDVIKTFKLIDKLLKINPKTEILGPQAFRPYPGSELYNRCIEYGWRPPSSLCEWSGLVEGELSYISPKKFPWIFNPDLVEAAEAYVRFGAHDVSIINKSSVKTSKILKYIFFIVAKARWKMKYFNHPMEYKIAKRLLLRKVRVGS